MAPNKKQKRGDEQIVSKNLSKRLKGSVGHEKVTIEVARKLLEEWRADPNKPEWVIWKFKLVSFDHNCHPTFPGESKSSAKNRWIKAKKMAERLLSGMPRRSKFLRIYLHLLDSGAPLMSPKDALTLRPKEPSAAFDLLSESLEKWNPITNPVNIRSEAVKEENSKKGILPGIPKLRVNNVLTEKTQYGSIIDEEIAEERKSKTQANAQTAVRFKYATPEQKKLWKEKEQNHSKYTKERDLIGRAMNQIQTAIAHGKLSKDHADDMLLIVLVVRTMPRCHYCNDTPDVYGTKDLGVDRVRSDLGYWECFLADLLVPCCWPCNQAKDQLTPKEFHQAMLNIVQFQDYGVAATVNVKPRGVLPTMRYFNAKAKQTGYTMTLTQDEVLALRDLPCYHCGIKDKNGSGLDRLQNLPIYDHDAVSSCWPCNKAKGYFPLQDFYAHSRKIVAHAPNWLP
jgi:hypothetical protein